jgi:hypothetical protein
VINNGTDMLIVTQGETNNGENSLEIMNEDGQVLCDDITSCYCYPSLTFSKKYEVINDNLCYLSIIGEEGEPTSSIEVIQLDVKT